MADERRRLEQDHENGGHRERETDRHRGLVGTEGRGHAEQMLARLADGHRGRHAAVDDDAQRDQRDERLRVEPARSQAAQHEEVEGAAGPDDRAVDGADQRGDQNGQDTSPRGGSRDDEGIDHADRRGHAEDAQVEAQSYPCQRGHRSRHVSSVATARYRATRSILRRSPGRADEGQGSAVHATPVRAPMLPLTMQWPGGGASNAADRQERRGFMSLLNRWSSSDSTLEQDQS